MFYPISAGLSLQIVEHIRRCGKEIIPAEKQK
jgi:hypothetical protein